MSTPSSSAKPRPLTVVVVPTYDEAGNIGQLLRRLRAAAPDVEMLVVDDASPDGTADLAEAMAAELGGIEVLRRRGKAGLGSAYRAGLGRALERGASVIVQMDADLSHAPEALGALVDEVHDGADLAIGSRYVPGGSVVAWPWYRRALSRGGNRYVSVLLGLGVRDATAGFRAWSASGLAAVELAGVTSEGYSFQIEMTRRAVRRGLRVVEAPITFTERARGASKLSWRIIGEAWWLVTRWALADLVARVRGIGRRRQVPVAE